MIDGSILLYDGIDLHDLKNSASVPLKTSTFLNYLIYVLMCSVDFVQLRSLHTVDGLSANILGVVVKVLEPRQVTTRTGSIANSS